jgi:hypothetical protein
MFLKNLLPLFLIFCRELRCQDVNIKWRIVVWKSGRAEMQLLNFLNNSKTLQRYLILIIIIIIIIVIII